MNYYHNLITQKSWNELIKLGKSSSFVLIGGWAVYLYAKTLKSKDIDVLVEYGQLSRLRKIYEVSKNERLKKYEARRGEIQIDIYLPHYSSIGIPVEDLMEESISLEGFRVLNKEWLIALKLFTLKERGRTPKGQKDFLDLLSLMSGGFDSDKISKILEKYKLNHVLLFFKILLDESVEIPELNLNRHLCKRLKDKIYLSNLFQQPTN